MASTTVPCTAVSKLASLLDSPQIAGLIADLEDSRWTGRPGYPMRSMVGIALAKSLYSISTWTKIIALVKEHESLSLIISPSGDIPSVHACYRFTKKLREHDHLLEKCITKIIHSLSKQNPEFGKDIAIDASDLPAYANGQRFSSKYATKERSIDEYSDPDASWGHRSAISTRKGGGFYGYKLHLVADTTTDLPLAWTVETGAANEMPTVAPLLDKLRSRGINPVTCAMDKGYERQAIYETCAERNIIAIFPLRQTTPVAEGAAEPPHCFHGPRVFAGADYKRKATKWRCAYDMCTPRSVWIKADRLHPLIPRGSERWKKLYKGRTAVEREFGRLKHEWAMLPLRVRGLKKIKLHVDLTILTKLACALIS
jgi:Transposase DDE domain